MSYRFPRDNEYKNMWIIAIDRKKLGTSTNSVICSVHFPPNSFEKSAFSTKLSNCAVPTLRIRRQSEEVIKIKQN